LLAICHMLDKIYINYFLFIIIKIIIYYQNNEITYSVIILYTIQYYYITSSHHITNIEKCIDFRQNNQLQFNNIQLTTNI